jgi:acetyl-CoA carboxylase biotin carboxyl carrier protein
MELKQIKELMAHMGRSGVKRLSLKNEGFEIEIERESRELAPSAEVWTPQDEGRDYQTFKKMPHELPATSQKLTLPHESKHEAEESSGGTYITSPMVGTFYSAPSPEDPPYVKVGDKVEKGTLVCIIEAMKVMNEIKAGQTGTIVEILVEAESPVEFGTKLFKIA